MNKTSMHHLRRFQLALVLIFLTTPVFSNDQVHEEYLSDKDLVTYEGQFSSGQGEFRFQVHGGKNRLELMEKVVQILEKEIGPVFEYFESIPRGVTHFIIQTKSNLANGAATVFPTNLIYLNDYPPTGVEYLSGSTDWLRILIIHELIHIIHLDQTSGVFNLLRSIFGSTAKLGGVVPRWFTEGVGVWGETVFTQEGRLRHRPFRYEYLKTLLEGEKCQDISCLDDPYHYPYRQFPYSAGAHFLEYLELRKSGTLRCLLKANSDSLPFFLNSAFIECTGGSASDNFEDFKTFVRVDYQKREQKLKNGLWGEMKVLSPSEGKTFSWQQGAFVFKDDFYVVESSKRIFELTKVNLTTKKRQSTRFDGHLGQLRKFHSGPFVIKPTAHLIDYRGKKARRWGRVFNSKLEKLQELEINAPYIFPFERPLHLTYKDMRWVLKDEDKILVKFPQFFTISEPQIQFIEKVPHLTFISQVEKEGSFLALNLEDLKTTHELYRGGLPLFRLGVCDNNYLLGQGFGRDKKVIIGDHRGGGVEGTGPFASEVSTLAMGISYNVATATSSTETRVYEGPCQDLITKIKRESQLKTFQSKTSSRVEEAFAYENREKTQDEVVSLVSSREKRLDSQFDSYPYLSHFLPNFWLFYYNFGDQLDSLDVTTRLSDPVDKNVFDLTASYYPEISELGGSISYTRQLGKISARLESQKYFTENLALNTQDSFESSSARFLSSTYWGRTQLGASAFFEKGISSDFISNRKFSRYGLAPYLVYSKMFEDDFLRLTSLVANVYKQDTESRSDFWGVQVKGQVSLAWGLDFLSHLKGTWGRLYKDDLSSGVLYGGGGNNAILGDTYFHEFYGIPYSEIFGNKISTARFQLEYIFSRPYNGSGLFPLYFKEVSILAGSDYVKTDFVYLDDSLRRDRDVLSAHLGGKFKVNAFYLVPVDVELIFSRLLESDVVDDSSALLLVSGSFF